MALEHSALSTRKAVHVAILQTRTESPFQQREKRIMG